MADGKKRVFISYSHKDSVVARQIHSVLAEHQLTVWLDVHEIVPGQSVSGQITDGLQKADYFILLISEDSTNSNWVKREIAFAIDLADKEKRLAVIPIVLDRAPIPLEFKGLFFIDATASIADALKRLVDYFGVENESSRQMGSGPVIRKSLNDGAQALSRCLLKLADLKTRDLRHHMANRLTLEDIKVIWFDLFESRMSDDVQIHSVALSCVEVIARCDREDQRDTLLQLLCRNHPRIAITLEAR